MIKRIVSLILVMMFLIVGSLSAHAHEIPDYNRRGSIDITMKYKDKVVPGGTLTLYRVADVATDDGNYFFTYTADFSDCSIPVTELSSSEIGAALAKIAKDRRLNGVAQDLDKEGHTKFSDLEIGLYLLVQNKAAAGYNQVSPFLVSVPGNDNGHYIYDVNASPKVELEPAPTTPTTPSKPSGGKLPQTGQVNWPVPILGTVGLILIAAGFCMKASDRRKKHEE